jgi:uncharacterized protein
MGLVQDIEKQLAQAQKEGAPLRVEVLRFVLAQLRNRSIEKRGQGKDPDLTEDEAQDVLRRETKKRKEALELYRQGERPDLAEKEEKEMAILREFLPAQMSEVEIEAAVETLRQEGHGDFNSLMKAAMERLRGKADGKTVSEIVRRKLG